jgi:predicted ATP-binding protein involved in virulence
MNEKTVKEKFIKNLQKSVDSYSDEILKLEQNLDATKKDSYCIYGVEFYKNLLQETFEKELLLQKLDKDLILRLQINKLLPSQTQLEEDKKYYKKELDQAINNQTRGVCRIVSEISNLESQKQLYETFIAELKELEKEQ